MRTRTQLSTLAIAAIAILTAATTSFAQTNAQTNERGAETATVVTMSDSELIASNAKQPVSPTSIENTVRESFAAKSVSETRQVGKPLTISAATFSAGSRFATVDANRFMSQQVTTELKMSAGVPSTTANGLSETETRNVQFVACRVPKTPFKD